ncbi:hypothetical protein [Komagataeibacter saccharivorans]|uniref:hypothetical protein n=1 Tax=Komagataeibacter saccharivorans TaxID=265959 RepID=UPI000C831A28|nr:hypothetical protein [Komagataeibacter saccharivorans]
MRTDLTENASGTMRHLRRSARITTEQWRTQLACWASGCRGWDSWPGFAMAADAAATCPTNIIHITTWILPGA